MSYIVDRRLNSKNKSTVNRQRFLKRYRKQIKKAVSDAVTKRGLTDMQQGESITIPRKDTNEPFFGHGSGGKRQVVNPGNKEFVAGDKIPRPQGQGSGRGKSGKGNASDSGDGMDDFAFQISQKEFLEFMFEDLALPNLLKRQLVDNDEFKFARAGFSESGSPNQVNIVRSLRSAYARRIALGGKSRRKRRELREALKAFEDPLSDEQHEKKQAIEEEIEHLSHRLNRIPFLDEFDLKYNLTVKIPQPSPKAVMFCLLDVSGSMTQEIKDTAKRFFFLLYLFLKKNYEKIEIVFIRHHASASEVDEQEFFHSRETGGTVVSSALELMNEVIESRYPADQWNIYGAQASDGDNWPGDVQKCQSLLTEKLLPNVQYYTYIEIGTRPPQEMWHSYERIQSQFQDNFAISNVRNNADIYPVFRNLFRKKTV